jgi:hypothetical protein
VAEPFSTAAATPLQAQACIRLLLPLLDYPRARDPRPIAWHVLEAFIKQRRLISSRDAGPGQDNGDLLCSGHITRGAQVEVSAEQPWSWLEAALPWQTPGLRPQLLQPDQAVLLPRVLQPPVEGGIAWLGDLDALQSPGVLPLQPRAQLCGCSLLTAGFPYGEGGIGRLVQPQLGEAIDLVLKPQRVIVLEPGDTLLALAQRYGTTVQTLRNTNPLVLPLALHLTSAGDSVLSLAGVYGTTVEWIMANNDNLQRFGVHTVQEGDTLSAVARQYASSTRTIRNYNAPTYDLWPGSEPLPLAAELVVPLIRPSSPLEPGQSVTVPGYRPSTPLPPGWLILPPRRRSLQDPDDRDHLDQEPEPEPEPDPQAEPEPPPTPLT